MKLLAAIPFVAPLVALLVCHGIEKLVKRNANE
jgi:hypothetical protein